MGDILQYRLPEAPIVKARGRFKTVNDNSEVKGFVISSFDKNEMFLFEEGEYDGAFFYNEKSQSVASKEEYKTNASIFLEEIIKRKLSKAVFSRIKNIQSIAEPDKLFNDLCVEYPGAFVYLISSPLFGTWIGATPEVLMSSKNGIGNTMALAGTIPCEETNWTEKEIFEQKYVTDFIAARLNDLNCTEIEVAEKSELIAGPVKHLVSRFSFNLNNALPIDVADKLHPTPAVSGLPQVEALELIRQSEKHHRSLYAGFLGLISENDSQLFVNLRCAQLTNDNTYLYLGGGFTCDSDVEKEWQETENKGKTLLKVIQNL